MDIAELAAEAGVTVEEMKRVLKTLENFRLEEGEEACRQFLTAASEAVKTAKADGVSTVVLLEAMARRLS